MEIETSKVLSIMERAKIHPDPTTSHRKVCFSYAAYAKNVITYLKSCNIPILEGLSEIEFRTLEISLGFKFPPDLRSILREGIPVGSGFPNWRSSSYQQLEILFQLPISGICNEIAKGNFWMDMFGPKPSKIEEAVAVAKVMLRKSPILVPIYKDCYMPSEPHQAGNPIFRIRGTHCRYSGYDLAGFFHNQIFQSFKESPISSIQLPAWAAKAARTIEFWSDFVEKNRGTWEGQLGHCDNSFFEELTWKLRKGGWKEEEVREMLSMDGRSAGLPSGSSLRDKHDVDRHLRLMSLSLFKAGWNNDDVAEMLCHTR